MEENKIKLNLRTDLAVESVSEVKEQTKHYEREEYYLDKVSVEIIDILESGSEIYNKKTGRYITLSFDNLDSKIIREELSICLKRELKKMFKSFDINEASKCLVIGLGNSSITPDSLGPYVIERLVVTNHLFEAGFIEDYKNYSRVMAISPGVMGQTGLETQDIITAIIEQIKPDFLVTIDALASRSISRLNKTIQITNTGIHPGSGVGNYRKEISYESTGIPVIALGVPTVVDAITIANDTLLFLEKHLKKGMEETKKPSSNLKTTRLSTSELDKYDLDDSSKEQYFGHVGKLSEEEKRQLFSEVLTPLGYNLMVTPKEVDETIESLAKIIAKGINDSLHRQVN